MRAKQTLAIGAVGTIWRCCIPVLLRTHIHTTRSRIRGRLHVAFARVEQTS